MDLAKTLPRTAQKGLALAFAIAALALTLPDAAQARETHRVVHRAVSRPVAFECAARTAVGEASSQSVVEMAIVIHGLVERARERHHSVCAEAHASYAPRYGRVVPSVWHKAVLAAQDVFSRGSSLVPRRFLSATEMRAPEFRGSPGRGFCRVGQYEKGGNVFYSLCS